MVAAVLAACGVAFEPGTRAPAPPEQVKEQMQEDDVVDPMTAKEGEVAKLAPRPSPTVGVTLVVGGEVLDAGGLPKPPIPIGKDP